MTDEVWPKRHIDLEQFPWVYGHDIFKDGKVVPWMRPCAESIPGYAARFVTVDHGYFNDKGVFIIEHTTKEWAYVPRDNDYTRIITR